MNRPLLFIARSWHGYGGMQRLNRGLAHHMEGWGEVVHPRHTGFMSLVVFCIRTLWQGVSVGKKGGHVHVSDCALLPIALCIRLLSSATVSVTAHGLDVVYRHFFYQWMLRRCLPYMHRVVCVSHATKEEVMQRGVTKEKIVVIPCGTEDAVVRRDRRDVLLLVSVGRLIPRKGIAWFLRDVFPVLLQTFPDLHYTIIGDGPERESIEKIIAEKNVSSCVTLITHANDAQRDHALSLASVFVMPNVPVPGDMEGFGIACIEAAVRGVPVAAARIEGIVDAVIEGKTGRLFSAGDAEHAVTILSDLLVHRMEPTSVSSSAQAAYSWPVIMSQYCDHVFA